MNKNDPIKIPRNPKISSWLWGLNGKIKRIYRTRRYKRDGAGNIKFTGWEPVVEIQLDKDLSPYNNIYTFDKKLLTSAQIYKL